MAIYRYITKIIKEDLEEKMVFIGGPRQVGKTTLSLSFLNQPELAEGHPGYFNWDYEQDRLKVLRSEIPKEKLLIFDEIHKYKKWRNFLKGIFDKRKSTTSIIVTGSARLDYYRRGGDSLQGRYHYHRLHPLSLREVTQSPGPAEVDALMQFGGFPEPFFKGNQRFHKRWQYERMTRVIQEDLRDLERVLEISQIQLLLTHLPACVGSPLSLNNLRELLQVAHASVNKWIAILERLYVCFRIPPYGGPKIRAVKKENKLYFWDWTQVDDLGARFENMVACQLLKYCHTLEDQQGLGAELRFIRDTDKREVDFIVLCDRKPLFAVECKTGEKAVGASTYYFRERTNIPKFYQVHRGIKDYGDEESGTRVLPFWKFCQLLQLP